MAILGGYVVVLAELTLLGSGAIGLENPGNRSLPDDEWAGQWADGSTLSSDDLKQILALHQKWDNSSTGSKEGKQADLSKCILRNADLPGVHLTGAILSGANLAGANLAGASLSGADLAAADLSNANLAGASLSRADLTDANLSNANLSGAFLLSAKLAHSNLTDADLSNANLSYVDLSEANLSQSVLSMAVLYGANLSGLDLRTARLSEAYFAAANLSGAILIGADLANSDLSDVIFRKAILSDANLSGANLSGADLVEADLTRVNLSGANLSGADLSDTQYDPKPDSLPDLSSLLTAINLDRLGFAKSEARLVELRSALADAGLRDVERQVNCAIHRGRQRRGWRDDQDWGGNLNALFNLLLFDYTCAYGMLPGRPLILMCVGILLCSVPYCLVILGKRKTPQSCIWLVVAHAGTKPDQRRKRRFRPLAMAGTPSNWRGRLLLFVRAALVSLYFSCLMAFRVGFREINVGNWIARMQCRDYSYSPTGRVRFVSGVQSVFSVYMLALWLLTYFGRPFE